MGTCGSPEVTGLKLLPSLTLMALMTETDGDWSPTTSRGPQVPHAGHKLSMLSADPSTEISVPHVEVHYAAAVVGAVGQACFYAAQLGY